MSDITANLAYESHSIAHHGPRLRISEKVALTAMGIGSMLLALSLITVTAGTSETIKTLWFNISWILAIGGGGYFALSKHLKDRPGVRNQGKTTDSLTSRGAWGWMMGIVFTSFYICLYWFPGQLEGLVRIHDQFSLFMRGRAADEWFVYGTIYTILTLLMGAKAIVKYRHNRYQIIRTSVIMIVQLTFSYLFPVLAAKFSQPEIYFSYLWPLAYDKLFPSSIDHFLHSGAIGYFIIGWFVVGTFVATPVLTYYFGKRWYCSWVCGCGGLANTMGDSWRQVSDKSLKSWKIERWTIHSVLAFIVILTVILWFEPYLPAAFKEIAFQMRKFYAFVIGAAFSGVVGVGFYPLMGTRVWCRFGCPMAAVLGILQRFNSRFRITTNGAQCISCGNCSKYCEMGIDVRHYAQRGQNIIRASCVGCGICATVCPRGVLSLENGPTEGRYNQEEGLSLLGKMKSK